MSQTTLNLIAITVFLFTLSALLGPLLHLSPAVPALAAFGLLSVATLDTLSWRGQTGTLVVDWFNQFSAEHRDRIVHHEAGHFLVAHLLDLPIDGYTLTAWDAFRQGQTGMGGVRFASTELEQAAQEGKLSAQLLDRYSTVLMAGTAAEMLVYGKATGGGADRQQLQLLYAQIRQPIAAIALKERWAIVQAKHLLQTHAAAYQALVTGMNQQQSVEHCQQIIETHRRREDV